MKQPSLRRCCWKMPLGSRPQSKKYGKPMLGRRLRSPKPSSRSLLPRTTTLAKQLWKIFHSWSQPKEPPASAIATCSSHYSTPGNPNWIDSESCCFAFLLRRPDVLPVDFERDFGARLRVLPVLLGCVLAGQMRYGTLALKTQLYRHRVWLDLNLV